MFLPHLPLADLSDIENNFQQVGLQTGFTLQQFIAQCIAFTVLFAVAWKFGWKPVRTILEQRRNTIEESMANADKIKQQLADAEASRLSIIQKANEQASAIIAEAEKAAVVRGEQRTQEAVRQAEDIIKKAREAAVLERDRLLAELKREVGALVVQTTEKIAGRVLTADDQTRLNDEAQRQLSASNN
ncbi:MAG: F0F1 ATP synthase subunit B [Methylacidiphilales bacterium]|nr:F0F1 ATP synthase subunit B [Candidatus Methylacidiphilales bacterium]